MSVFFAHSRIASEIGYLTYFDSLSVTSLVYSISAGSPFGFAPTGFLFASADFGLASVGFFWFVSAVFPTYSTSVLPSPNVAVHRLQKLRRLL